MPWHLASRYFLLGQRIVNVVYLMSAKRGTSQGGCSIGRNKGSPPKATVGPACVSPPEIKIVRSGSSMQSESQKQINVVRLKADIAAASVEILSAHCAVDRVRLNYSPKDVVSHF